VGPDSESSGTDEVVISDPRAIRALAHPARVAVLEHLFGGAVLTATECAKIAGLTPSAMSYHLRALERYGLVGRAEGGDDGRERPWRALGRGMRLTAESSIAGRTAESLVAGRVIDRMRDEVLASMAHRHDVGPDDDRPAGFGMAAVQLTPEEATAFVETLTALDRPYADRVADPSARPAGTLEYHVFWALSPALDVPGPDGPA
jgi:DNA-binding transcriptional ArsR family regulator